jgi:hypothetical protein
MKDIERAMKIYKSKILKVLCSFLHENTLKGP